MEKKKADQKRLQLEIMRINEENLLAKERRKEEEKLADLHAMEFTRSKLVSYASIHFSGRCVSLWLMIQKFT